VQRRAGIVGQNVNFLIISRDLQTTADLLCWAV